MTNPFPDVDYSALADKGMSERWWQKEVVTYAHKHGWMAYHALPARRGERYVTAMMGDSGFTDWCFARDGVILLVELKKVGQRPDAGQRLWLKAAGAFGFCWTPADRAIMEATLS